MADSNWHRDRGRHVVDAYRDSNWHVADSNWHRDSNWH